MGLFKNLTKEEEKVFRDWARMNYKPFAPILKKWHPSVQRECVLINLCHGVTEVMEDNGNEKN